MDLSLNVTDFRFPGGAAALAGELTQLARTVERAGLHTLWVPDHLLAAAPGASVDDPTPEGWTTLAYLAARTERIHVGTMVSAVSYRPPALLIKMATTLDVLSGGRAWLGLGAGYLESEAQAMGLPLPPMAQRFDLLADTLELAHRMFADDRRPWRTDRLELAGPINQPAPLSRPRPRILVGGSGERRTLPLVARWADATNLFDAPGHPEVLTRKIDVLRQELDALGRPVDEVSVTVSIRLATGERADELAARCTRLAALGVGHVVVITEGPWTPEALDVLTAARPLLADL